MWLHTPQIILLISWSIGTTGSAIYPNGTKAVLLVSENDPSPIGDPTTYYPDQHDCPLACLDYANINSWITYFSIERLQRCREPMLVQFSVLQPLDDPNSNILIRSCSLEPHREPSQTAGTMLENPKKAASLFLSSLKSSLACTSTGVLVEGKVKVAASSAGENLNKDIAIGLLEGLQRFYGKRDNCDEGFVFAVHNRTSAGIYIGSKLAKRTIETALQEFANHMQASSRNNTIISSVAAELCGSGRDADRGFGIVIDNSGGLAAVQRITKSWSKGNCAAFDNPQLTPTRELSGIEIHEIVIGNGTNSTTGTFEMAPPSARRALMVKRQELRPAATADGTCTTHLIQNGDTCDKIAKQYGVKVDDLEKYNKGKTWAWTECKDMLIGYNMCVSDGSAPMPPPQQGAECGPLVPGTQPPSKSTSLADLNPCPLKACCSNWGFCGVFPAHCTIHAPAGGGPGSKEKGFQNTCVSNCGSEIKQNSGAPSNFQRIGYYESYNLERPCLWLKAKNANTDGSYTHIHWAFAEIDASSWTVIIKDKGKQWNDFKKLSNVKRIVSFGGWAYSTEAATYNIIRSAIINNRDTFAANLAKFAKDEGIDGIDIDWEYPGAPDIMVGDKPIGQKGDGLEYLKFLTVLKKNMGSDKSVSIAAPASYWYLKAFPIDRIAAVIDYIVYMTYDLHGQWDYGNPNAYDSCPSGKCIRSHVNLTETRNSLAMITKAGVPNNKIFVGEASYGRSFHMAQDGCWGPMCDFTGSRTQSDANPGRCTKTGGYVSYAEINELIKTADGARTFHDGKSNSDVMIYKGDYISYMTPATKETRRSDWKSLNFAGSIDWAVDLQAFTSDDMTTPELPEDDGNACVSGEDISINSGDLCEFSCNFGFCPESLCECVSTGDLQELPPVTPEGLNVMAWDVLDVDLNRLCKFACKYGYCPNNICTRPEIGSEDDSPIDDYDSLNYDITKARLEQSQSCIVYKDRAYKDVSLNQCKATCQDIIDQAREEDRITNYGCIAFFPLEKKVPWERAPGGGEAVKGKCSCDNPLFNEFARFFMEALPALAQIGCYIMMSTIKLIVDVGSNFIPGAGQTLHAGLDAAITAAQLAAWYYPEGEDPAGAFDFWLNPCGGTDLVPEDLKNAFDILSAVGDGVSSFKEPKNLKKGGGRKGDDGNPKTKPKPGGGGNGGGGGGTGGGVNKPKPKCKIPAGNSISRIGHGKNTVRMKSCAGDKTRMNEIVITSLSYAANAAPLRVQKKCEKDHSQACFHYSSAIRVNPQWATLTCDGEAATTAHRLKAKATAVWSSQHRGKGWQAKNQRAHALCDRDEYPPAYLLSTKDPAYVNSGVNSQGQLVRYVPDTQNRGAGQMWKGACFIPAVEDLSDSDIKAKANNAVNKQYVTVSGVEQTLIAATVTQRPEFSISQWGHSGSAPANDGLNINPCWPSAIAAADPGMALLTYDPYYARKSLPYDYQKPYAKGSNGS